MMRYFPLFFDLSGRTVLLAGGGEQMAQKARLILRTEARIQVMAPDLTEELAGLVASGRLEHVNAVWDEAAVAGADLVFAATGCVGIDAMIASQTGAPVNVVDRPKLCDVITPAIVDRDPLVIAIGTEGTAPVLARDIRAELETMLEPELGGFLSCVGGLRGFVADHVAPKDRRAFWEGVFNGPARQLWQSGAQAEAEAEIRRSAHSLRPRDGQVTVIALPDAVDLLPMRALRRLQAADLVIGGNKASEALDLARRDAERAALPGSPAGLAAMLARSQLDGARAVVLLSPDEARRHWPRLTRLAPERIGAVPADPRPVSALQEAG
ncbi:MAG: siroheme synthase [Pseudomonadota bacterium]